MGLFKFLKKIEGWPAKKQFLIFFVIILIPNLLRQVLYLASYSKFHDVGFIVSYETTKIFTTQTFYLGFFQEIAIGIVFAILWFKFRRLKFLSYAWITDALFDYISVIVWVFVGLTPLQMLGLSTGRRFLFREVVFFYVISGPLLYKFKANIKKLSVIYSIIAIIFLIIILAI